MCAWGKEKMSGRSSPRTMTSKLDIIFFNQTQTTQRVKNGFNSSKTDKVYTFLDPNCVRIHMVYAFYLEFPYFDSKFSFFEKKMKTVRNHDLYN